MGYWLFKEPVLDIQLWVISKSVYGWPYAKQTIGVVKFELQQRNNLPRIIEGEKPVSQALARIFPSEKEPKFLFVCRWNLVWHNYFFKPLRCLGKGSSLFRSLINPKLKCKQTQSHAWNWIFLSTQQTKIPARFH